MLVVVPFYMNNIQLDNSRERVIVARGQEVSGQSSGALLEGDNIGAHARCTGHDYAS